MNMTEFDRIQKLKKEKDAIILSHYYVPDEVQAISDAIGDSYYLSKYATTVPQQTIVFCGVRFMGESAKLLCPDKKVLMPDFNADCPMAHMADPEMIEKARQKYPDLAVVCYINSTTELKAVSDVCVTSANAIKVVQSLEASNIYFIPDQNLARYVAERVPEKNFIFHDGYCPIHTMISTDDILNQKALHPNALVLAHPECPPAILQMADYIGSSSGIIHFAETSAADDFIIATEIGLLYELHQKCQQKNFYPASKDQICSGMKLNSLGKIIQVLEKDTLSIDIDQTLHLQASSSLEKMLTLA